MPGKSKHQEVVLKKNRVLNLILNHSGEYGAEDIGELFGLSKRTIQLFIEEFNNMGFVIESRKGKYTITQYPTNFNAIQKLLLNKEMKKYFVYQEIKRMSRGKSFINKRFFCEHFLSSPYRVAETQSTLDKIIKTLEQEGYIYIKNGKLCCYENPFDSMKDFSIFKMLIFLKIMKNIYPRNIVLNEIYNKLFWEGKQRKIKYSQQVFHYPQKNKISIYDECILEVLEKSIVDRKVVILTYKNMNNKKLFFKIRPSGLIYNRWKDMWYVVESGVHDKIYRLDRIINIRLSEESYEFIPLNKELYTTSFGISNEPIVEVEVEFEKVDFIYNRLQHYAEERTYCSINEEEDKYVLKDKVCGYLEFEKWIRGFGRSAKCIKPQALQDKILRDIKIMAERYEI